MAAIQYTTPRTRSSNILSTVANSLANGSESSTVTYDNSSNKDPYSILTLKLGSITPSTGGSVSIRITINDGTDTSDKIGGEIVQFPLTSGASAKVGIQKANLPPFSLRLSIINNAGAALPASGNELYVRSWSEETV